MMQSFLDLSADYLLKTHSVHFDKVNIVLPTRRSGQELEAMLQKKGAEKMPVISHIEDFIEQNTEGKKQNAVLLLLELFDVFQQKDPSIRLEKFTSWGYILLKDFDLIDRNLVDAQKLFANLADIKNIDRWQISEDDTTPKIKEYFQLWENLQEVYQKFKERLMEMDMAYAGMLYQQLAQHAKERLVHHPDFNHFVFLGFNALSKSEEAIFKTLLDAKKAEVIWDADSYYMKPNDENKAGLFLRKYKKNWAHTHWFFQSEYLAQSAKNITVLSVANASMQGKVANQLIKTTKNANKDTAQIPPTALVLGDEHLLLPVLHSLDSQIGSLNICMGLSLKDSALFNLVDILFEQQQTLIRDRNTDALKFNHRSIIKLFNHPFIRQFEKINCPPEEEYERRNLLLMFSYYINANNLIYLGLDDVLQLIEEEYFTEKRMEDKHLDAYCERALGVLTPLFEVLFQRWENVHVALDTFGKLAEMLVNPDSYLEKAYFKEFESLLSLLKGFVSRRPGLIDMRTFKIFMYQAFREAHFDFDSDSQANLQLMGINETRNLDFKHVIVLSVNETVLPRSKRINSFIPVDIAKAFELPTYAEQDAVVSYHFYRLLQRAEEITLVYVSPSDTYGGKEKSRFILQLENDLVRYNPLIKMQEKAVKFRALPDKEEVPIRVEKTNVEIEKIKENIRGGFSPSDVNSFVSCSLQYYFKKVAKIRKPKVVEESLGANKIGDLVHEILENMFSEMTQSSHFVEAATLESLLPSIFQRVEDKLASEHFKKYALTGANFIVKNVIAQMIEQFIRQQINELEEADAAFEILTIENEDNEKAMGRFRSPRLGVDFQLEINSEKIPIKVQGITDRVDRLKGVFRIVDYKTGKVEPSQLSTKIDKKEYETSDADLIRTKVIVESPEADKIRQLWLYKFILLKEISMHGKIKVGHHTLNQDSPLAAGIYGFRNIELGFQEIKSGDKQDALFPEDIAGFLSISEDLLSQIIGNMLDPTQAFEQTEDLKKCVYCDFKGICNR